MFKNLSNQLFAEAEQPAAEQPATEQQKTENLIKKLTPNSSKKEITNLRESLERLKKQFEELRNDVDPRMFNNPLPNDSKITYQYGARSYVVDCYPGYTWRNGNWFKITPDLMFEPTPKLLVTNCPDPTGLADQSCSSSMFCIIDDSYYPIIINGTRVFVKEVFRKVQSYNGTLQMESYRNYAYFPFNQNIINISTIPNFYPNGQQKNIIHQNMKIEYEDFNNMKDVRQE